MSKKSDFGEVGVDGTKTTHKGDNQQSHQKGAPSVSNKAKGKHQRDESAGAESNTTKKQQNSI